MVTNQNDQAPPTATGQVPAPAGSARSDVARGIGADPLPEPPRDWIQWILGIIGVVLFIVVWTWEFSPATAPGYDTKILGIIVVALIANAVPELADILSEMLISRTHGEYPGAPGVQGISWRRWMRYCVVILAYFVVASMLWIDTVPPALLQH